MTRSSRGLSVVILVKKAPKPATVAGEFAKIIFLLIGIGCVTSLKIILESVLTNAMLEVTVVFISSLKKFKNFYSFQVDVHTGGCIGL